MKLHSHLQGWNPLPTADQVRRSVRGKLMRIVLITTALAVWVAGIAMLTYDLNVYRASSAADLANEAGILALSTGPALAFDDRETAERDLKAMQARPQVLEAALYSADGRLYAAYSRAGEIPAPARLPFRPGVRAHGQQVELVQRVQQKNEVLGAIYLRAQYDLVGRFEAYLGIFALVTLLSLAVAYVFSNSLQKAITAPLEAMTGVARAVVSRRDYSLRSQKTTDDEIGVVVDAFNSMLDEVQARTRALEQSNQALQDEIRERRAAQAALRDADRRKDEFLATLAHELRNPLAPIRHAVKLLESQRPDQQQGQWARQVISRQVQRMALLLDDLLEVSRITRGRLDLKPAVVELDALIGAAVETARPSVEAKQQRLTVHKPAQAIHVRVDPLRLSQSLSNLLTNASKYTDSQGEIALLVDLSPEQLTLRVRDTGIGLEAAVIPGLFAMFSQVDSALDRSEGGLGIGLALVKGLVTLHGGTVEATSPGVGLGSEFTIRLPAAIVVTPTPAADEKAAAVPAEPGAADSGSCILVADDNRDAADSLAMVLEMTGHRVFSVHSGTEALAALLRHRPQVAILDIGMPDLTGYEVAEAVRREPWGRSMHLIAVTGWGQTEDKERAHAAGFDQHLTKPVDPDRVEALLRELHRARRRA